MYHPFDETIMAAVAASLTRSLEADRRNIQVLYFKAVHREVWDQAPAFKLLRETPLYALYEPKTKA